MTTFNPSLVVLFVAVSLFACGGQSSEVQDTAVKNGDVLQVYYFHFTKRCATCNAVENETRLALELNYADQLKDGKIELISLNLEEDDGKEMAASLNISGQTLLIVKGSNKVNLTNEGFMNARTKPDKFKEILQTQIDKLL